MAEILAPAGGQEQLVAAVRCGAGAVYLGATGFNARRNAKNFDEESFPAAVRWCHERGARVYVTLNTLVTDAETDALAREAQLIASSGADAVIVQDMAVLRLLQARWPALPRFASTQTAVHNVDGAKRLADMGFDGVVLARELSLREMESICAAVDVRKEAFVHGAHCMSVSGACYLSAMLGGRSGNRGLCAQPCRLDWRCGERHSALSLKDMSLIPHLRELESVGVDSFKIEGRMKRPEYVAAAVTACRKALAGEPYDADTLRAVFSRSGFTDGYLTGARDAEMFGFRSREDVTGAEPVLKGLAELYRKETPLVPVDLRFTATEETSALCVSDGVHTATAAGERPQEALTRALDADTARARLLKTGGTPYYVRDFAADVAPGRMLTASALNALRRDALDALTVLRGAPPVYEERVWAPAPPERHRPAAASALWGRFASPEQIGSGAAFEKIFLPAESIGPELLARYGGRLCAELPAVLFPEDEPRFDETLAALRDAGLREVLTDNVYGVELGQRLGLAVHGGFGLNVMNTEAVRCCEEQGLASLTLSFELALTKLTALGGGLPRGIVAYGRLPLMRWRNCPLRANLGCAACGGHGTLTDRLGVEFPVECGRRRYSSLLNSIPLHIGERDTSAFDHLLLYFTVESPADCARITEEYRQKRRAEGRRTGGLYYRELL